MKFRAAFFPQHINLISGVISTFKNAAKNGSGGGGSTGILPPLEVKLTPTNIILRMFTGGVISELQYFALLHADEFTSEFMVESRANNNIGLELDILSFASAFHAAMTSERTVVKLQRRGASPSLNFEFTVGVTDKQYKLWQHSPVRVLTASNMQDVGMPPRSLFSGCNVVLEDLMDWRAAVERMKKLDVDVVKLAVELSKDDNQRCDLRMSAFTQAASIEELFPDCGVQQLDGDKTTRQRDNGGPDGMDDEAEELEDDEYSQYIKARHLLIILQSIDSRACEFVMLKMLKERCLFLQFALKHTHKSHIICAAPVSIYP